ncbi:MAG TPA: polysaccharide biosynthesis tyrosine autokinase [Candidatus Acidoferrales bacterium]|nr:polysaccharide biosynthesis tyrosine autokinase [Candidatus Acidoferrales bacterium]
MSVLLSVFTILLIATLKEKPVYEAKGLLEIDQENPGVVTVQDLFQMGNITDDYLATQYRVLQSDTLAREVVLQLRLDQVAEFNSSNWHWPWQRNHSTGSEEEPKGASDAAHEQAVLKRVEAGLSVKPVERSRLVKISFDSEDPKLAASVINALASDYIQENLRMHWEATQRASTWLSQQLDSLKIKLEKSEDELQSYVEANGLLLVADDKGQTENIVDDRLRELQQELTRAQAERYQKEAAYRLIEGGDYDSLPSSADNKVIQDMTDRLADLERQRAELAPEFKPDYPKMRELQSEIDRVKQLIQAQRAEEARQVSNDYLDAVRREALVQRAFQNQQREANDAAEKSVQYGILKREVDSNQQMYEGVLQRLKEAGISAGMKASNIRIVDSAVPPVSPIRPRIAFNLMLGAFMGLVLGLAVVFAQEKMDTTLKSVEEAEDFLEVPILASIPSQMRLTASRNGHRRSARAGLFESAPTLIESRNHVEQGAVDELHSTRREFTPVEGSIIAEAFRGLRTSVLLSSSAYPVRSLLIASAEPAEGKTTICCNLAIALARLDKRVLVVDADLRRPAVHEFFRGRDDAGLVNYLSGEEEWRHLVLPTCVKKLEYLASGPVPPNPAELLSSERLRNLMHEATASYDFVIVDSPPLLRVSDGRILSTLVESTILVIRGNTTPRALVRRAQLQISSAGAHLMGVVLNDGEDRGEGYPSAHKARIEDRLDGIELQSNRVSNFSAL